MGFAFAALSVAVQLDSPRVAAAADGGAWHGTAEGVRFDVGTDNSGDIQSTSISMYEVSLSFSFSVGAGGAISGSGDGHYEDADWHLFGVNGDNGSFDCDPPLTADPFAVDVGGDVGPNGGTLTLGIPDATETNADYDCGADYTGYATTTHAMSDSLSLVGGDSLDISASHTTSKTLSKTVDSGGGDSTEDDTHIWTFSITPPPSSSNGGSGGGDNGGGDNGSPCSLKLDQIAAKPSPGHVNSPIVVSFHVSAAAHATLLVTPSGGSPKAVAGGAVGPGKNALVWGGFLGSMPAPAGSYSLTVQAKGCGVVRKGSTSDTTS